MINVNRQLCTPTAEVIRSEPCAMRSKKIQLTMHIYIIKMLVEQLYVANHVSVHACLTHKSDANFHML